MAISGAGRVPYGEFIASKRLEDRATGIDCQPEGLDPRLFPFQREITAWALRRGRAGIFEATGLGKTAQQLVWADHDDRLDGERRA